MEITVLKVHCDLTKMSFCLLSEFKLLNRLYYMLFILLYTFPAARRMFEKFLLDDLHYEVKKRGT